MTDPTPNSEWRCVAPKKAERCTPAAPHPGCASLNLYSTPPSSEPTCPTATCHGCPDPEACDAIRPVPSSDTPSGERATLTPRQEAIEAILIRYQDHAFSFVARRIDALFTTPAPSSSPVGDRGLDELRKLSDAASDGPWEWVGDELVGPHDPHDLEDFPDEDRREYLLAVQHVAGLANPQPADAAFIAAAVNYVRALLAAAPSPAPLAGDRWVCFDSGDLCSHHDPHPGCRYVDRFPPTSPATADRSDLESILDDLRSEKHLDAENTLERLLAAADRGEPTDA